MLKSILVHIPTERLARPVIDSAVSLANARGLHLEAVSLGYETADVGLVVEAGGAAATAVFAEKHEQAAARASAALAVFETEARLADIRYHSSPVTGVPFETAAAITALSRLHDLSIVLQPEPGRTTFDNNIPLEILFRSGGPVLFIPYTHKGPFNPKRIGIAWDGSRLAARAVRDATPFLSRADTITIISVNEAEEGASPQALVASLSRHGLTAAVQNIECERKDIQPAILSIAADEGLDLIVMGGYGHSRLQERILGGVTRGMVQSMTVPTLMSH
jgi:nucleotide-binding universal stress UspA family protein